MDSRNYLEKSMLENKVQYTRSGRLVIPPLASWIGERIVTTIDKDNPKVYYGLQHVDSKSAYLLPSNAYERHKRQSSSSPGDQIKLISPKGKTTAASEGMYKTKSSSGIWNIKLISPKGKTTAALEGVYKTKASAGIRNAKSDADTIPGSRTNRKRKVSNKESKNCSADFSRLNIKTNTLKRKRQTFNALSLGSLQNGDEMNIAKKHGVQAILKLEESLKHDNDNSCLSIKTPKNLTPRLTPVSDRRTPVFKSRFSSKEFETSRSTADAYLFRRSKILLKKTSNKQKNSKDLVIPSFLIQKSKEGAESCHESIVSTDLEDYYFSDSENEEEVYCNH